MQCFQGKSVYKGIVMGPVAVLKKMITRLKEPGLKIRKQK